jgi:hypothetical protein
LEFLAREERYILDGDREELRNIKNELSALRSASYGYTELPSHGLSALHRQASKEAKVSEGVHGSNIDVVMGLDRSIDSNLTPIPTTLQIGMTAQSPTHTGGVSIPDQAPSDRASKLARLKEQLDNLLTSGVYADDDAVVVALRSEIARCGDTGV